MAKYLSNISKNNELFVRSQRDRVHNLLFFLILNTDDAINLLKLHQVVKFEFQRFVYYPQFPTPTRRNSNLTLRSTYVKPKALQ